MKTNTKKSLLCTIVLFVAFIVFTVCVKLADVAAIGPEGSSVGLSSINGALFNLTGFSETLYKLTKAVGLLCYAMAGVLVLYALWQCIQRKSLLKLDKDLYVLGGFYVIWLAVYVLFEKVVINYRPVIIHPEEGLEGSYPSSHTLLAVAICLTTVMEIRMHVKKTGMQKLLCAVCLLIMAFEVIGRMLCGCHWLTDIVGGIILGSALVSLYCTGISFVKENTK